LNTKQLQYFVRIAELGSFRKASEALHIAQPALTRHIKNLEEALSVQLFNRSSSGVMLSSAGRLLLERARFILRQTEQARADVMAEGTVPSGAVTFGAPPSISQILFPLLSVAYLTQYPNVQLRFFEGVSHLHDWLLNDEIDLAILPNSRLSEKGNFSLTSFVGEPVYLVGAAGALEPGSRYRLEDVTTLPLVLTPSPSTVRGWLDRMVVNKSFRLHVVAETESLEVQKALVKANLGFALLPHSAVFQDFKAGNLSLGVVDDLSLNRVLAWRTDRPLTPAVKRMVDLTEEKMNELQRSGAFGFEPQ